ncbi:MAG: ABC transporter ATP-binding protein [Gammaproteobacteria bacterium]|nr:ABC transporter ATP-binding protein [Gammaproteobacteria bacterium]
MTTLAIENLVCQYDGKPVISDLSLCLKSNEIVALLGPSGCGKTTLLRAIAGLQAVTQGSITMGDTLVSSSKVMIGSEKRHIGMIFQDYALFPHLTVAQNVGFGISRRSKIEQQEQVEQMLKLVKLEPFSERFPHELSGGQQQRVAIARALAYQPNIMLLDEPFSNIDSQSRLSIMMEIRGILKQQQVPAVFVTHSKDEAFAFADKLAIFNQGKIEQIGSAQDLYLRPKSPYVASFMGKANFVDIIGVDQQCVTTAIGKIDLLPQDLVINLPSQIMLRPEQLKLTADASSHFYVEHCFFGGSHWVYQIKDHQRPSLVLEVHHREHFELNTAVAITIGAHPLVIFN